MVSEQAEVAPERNQRRVLVVHLHTQRAIGLLAEAEWYRRDLCLRWPSRLVATAAKRRLKVRPALRPFEASSCI
jgi:hypothetical protein